MTTDLIMLVWSAVLCLVLPLPYLVGRMQTPGGMEWALGNRDKPMEMPPWVGRAQRAHMNLVENLAPFAVLVLVVHLGGKANQWTALGAMLFFWGRVAHAATYILGIVGVRTLAFFVGTAGELLILIQLLR